MSIKKNNTSIYKQNNKRYGGDYVKRPTKQKGNNAMHSGLNPQGYSENKADQEPKSQLEQKAKHSHTKR